MSSSYFMTCLNIFHEIMTPFEAYRCSSTPQKTQNITAGEKTQLKTHQPMVLFCISPGFSSLSSGFSRSASPRSAAGPSTSSNSCRKASGVACSVWHSSCRTMATWLTQRCGGWRSMARANMEGWPQHATTDMGFISYVYVFVCVCICICICFCICICICICSCICICTCICIWICICICICKCVFFLCICTCQCICVFVNINVYVRICMYIYMFIYIYIYACVCIYICKCIYVYICICKCMYV